VPDFQAKSAQAIRKLTRQAMNPFGDCSETSWPVIHGIHRSDDSQKDLRSADVTCRFVAADVLLACL
jgi:hypothetical protein